MRLFPHFPKDDKCLICNTNADRPCFLMPIDGTQEENLCQSLPVHVDCLRIHYREFRFNPEAGIIYMPVTERK